MILVALLFLPFDDTTAEPPPFPQDGTFRITVVDPDGRPIERATLDPWALRMGGGHGSWNEPAYGPKPTPTTGPDGVATFTVPTLAGDRKLETVSAIVHHPDFVPLYEHVDAGNSLVKDKTYEATLTMRPGTKLRIEVVALDGDVAPESLSVTCPGVGTGDLPFTADGDTLITHPVSEDATLVRVTSRDEDGDTQFGDWIAWSPGVDGSTELTAILQKGLTVKGRLSENVPRPVRRGWVTCTCSTPGPTYEHRGLGQTNSPVEADGSFVLENVPHDCDLQITAICEGYTSEPPSEADHQRMQAAYESTGRSRDGDVFHMPFVAKPPEDGTALTLPMREAAVLRVIVKNPDGSPAAGVRVATNPNEVTYGLGSTLFAQMGLPREDWSKKPEDRSRRGFEFSGVTDADGVCVIGTMPPGRQSVDLYTGDWRDGTYRELTYEGDGTAQLKSGETSEVAIQLADPLDE